MVVGRAADQQYIQVTKDDDKTLAAVAHQLNALPLESIGKKWRKNWLGVKARQSPFWRVALHLSREWTGGDLGNMVWSNLYKIATPDVDPDENLRASQFDSCKELLLAEITFFKPKVVVFLTGMDWADPFLEGIENIMKDAAEVKYLKFVGRYEAVPVMATIQPTPGVNIYFPGHVQRCFYEIFLKPSLLLVSRMAVEREYLELDNERHTLQEIDKDYAVSLLHSGRRAGSADREKAIASVREISVLQCTYPEDIPLIVKEFYQLRFPVIKDRHLSWDAKCLVSAEVQHGEGATLVTELAARYPDDSFIFVENAYGPEGLHHAIVSDSEAAIQYLKSR